MLSPECGYPLERVTRSVVFLKNFITNPNIEVGDYTYFDGRDRPEKFELENVIFGHNSRLLLGKFCQLAYGTKFILNDANHQMNGFSTYPFFVFGEQAEGCSEWANYPVDLPDRGDTVVGHDVWFAHESVILPGVKIGSGAIVGARAVVNKDVPPFAVVAGNPAKVVRHRFPPEVVEELLEIGWWNWEIDRIVRNLAAITGGDIEALKLA